MRGALLALAVACLSITLSIALGPRAASQEKESEAARDALRRASRPTAVDRAVDRGLERLVELQRDGGAIAHDHQNRNAMTGLALLALLSRGHVPSTEEGDRMGNASAKALEFILGNASPDGYLGAGEARGGMYSHGIAVLALAELLGMGVSGDQDEHIARALRKGIDIILESQRVRKSPRHAGGWRYDRDSVESDLSVTVWMLMALRAAQNAGVDVPRDVIDRAVAYVEKCFERGGGFAYKPEEDSGATFSMTAAGVLSLQVCGRYDAREVRESADWFLKRTPDFRSSGSKGPWFYYGVYYYAQAMHQLGGKHAELAREVVEELLVSGPAAAPGTALKTTPQDDGSWGELVPGSEESKAGPVYRTSLAILALAVEYRYLPIYQR